MSPRWNATFSTTTRHSLEAGTTVEVPSWAAIARLLVSCLLISAIFSARADELPESPQDSRFEGYPNAPEIRVVPRKDDLFFYPCNQCHEAIQPNAEIRPLSAPHDSELTHGRGLIWCLSCHDVANRDNLRTLLNEQVDFDDAHLVCAGCHANRHKDWTFGVHGKRVDNWTGERTQFSCTHCHDPHKPAIAPRAPQPPPPVRTGLELTPGSEHVNEPAWARPEVNQE